MESLIRVVSAARLSPLLIAERLGAVVVLESSSFEHGRDRYSLMMVDEAFRLVDTGEELQLHRHRQRFRIHSRARDILDLQLYFANQHSTPHQDYPYPAGGVGWLSYEFARKCDRIRFRQAEDPLSLPDAAILFGHTFVVFDHFAELLYLIGLNYREAEIDLHARLDQLERMLHSDEVRRKPEPFSTEWEREADESDRDRYLEGVTRVREEVIAGNLLQGVLSRRVSVRTNLNGFDAYRRLRAANPSPYLFYLDFGDYELFGSSPELHVKVRNGRATVRPIAGTRRRGTDAAADAQLEQELLADEKERAEHLMLVDLARNDLGRVCEPGTVTVDRYMSVERYSHVMHIVSEVSGNLTEGKNGLSALRATFPAGTVSGAPKIRAIETVDRLEPVPRRFYAGTVGYMEPGGNLDTCITLRSALRRGEQIILQAGAGVVYDSVPEREFAETEEKLGALYRALGMEASG